MSTQALLKLLRWLTWLLVLLAAVTLLPFSSNLINDLGYHSLCPFAPYSSGALLLGAGVAAVIRSYLNQSAKLRNEPKT